MTAILEAKREAAEEKPEPELSKKNKKTKRKKHALKREKFINEIKNGGRI